MNSVFLSYSFSKSEDRDIVSEIEDLFRCFGIGLRTGRHLGGHQLTAQIQQIISESDGLIALATRRDQLASGGWKTHPWVSDEFAYAKAHNVKAIVMVEDGVEHGGAYTHNEYISFKRDDLDPALLKLAKTLGLWKSDAGRQLRVRLLPDDLMDVLDTANCQYRFVTRGQHLDWSPVKPVTEAGGAFLHLDGVRDGYLIEVQMTHNGQIRKSRATDQSMPIELE